MYFLQIVWTANPEFIDILGLSIRWYGVLFALGFLIGFFIIKYLISLDNVPVKVADDILIYVAIGAVAGGRLGHCFFYEPEYYLSNPLQILNLRQGGMASHGAVIGIILSVFFFVKYKLNRSFFWLGDRVVIPVALAASFIRLGNLFNHEIYGHATDVPWAFQYVRNVSSWMGGADPIFTQPSHPTQLYEAFSYMVLFAALWFLFKKFRTTMGEGFIAGIFLMGMFTIRFLIEFVKEVQVDFEVGMALNMGQILSIPAVLLGLWLLISSKNRKIKYTSPAIKVKSK
ncbi:MAG: prolipoprotein diacylglyceryl transferase [Chitinophagaceae bacterium]|nr:MAG: prolipoprotein diacylglyceryl transferase [Chitinophagaceae bacterium]